MAKIQEGESVDVQVELQPIELLFEDCYRGADAAAYIRTMRNVTGMQVIADAYFHDRPEGWRELHDQALGLIEGALRAVGAQALVDQRGHALMCDGRRPHIYQGLVGAERAGGPPQWSAGLDPSLEAFAEPRTTADLMERAAFLDALHDRAGTEGAADLDPELIGLQRAAAWERLREQGVERRLLVEEGVAFLTVRGKPRALIGRLGLADGRPSLAEMTYRERLDFGLAVSRGDGIFARSEPLPSDLNASLDGSGMRRLWCGEGA